MNEADTCRKYVVPKLTEAGWDDAPHFIGEQRNFTDGRVILAGDTVTRGKQFRLYMPLADRTLIFDNSAEKAMLIADLHPTSGRILNEALFHDIKREIEGARP